MATDRNSPSLRKASAAAGADIRIKRGEYVNWTLIGTVGLLTLVSSASVLPPVLSDRISNFWIFSKSEMMVIVGLSLTLILLAGLAQQQRYLNALRRQFVEIQNAEKARAEKHTSRLYALLNVGRMMVAQSDLQHVFDSIVKLCSDVFNCDMASLMIHDAETATLEVRAVSGKTVPQGMLGARQPVDAGIAGLAAKNRRPLLLHPGVTSLGAEGVDLRKKDVLSAMVVPIILRDELVGVINVSARTPGINFDDDDVRALQAFAENVGAAIRHTEQADWMRATIRKLQDQRNRAQATVQRQA